MNLQVVIVGSLAAADDILARNNDSSVVIICYDGFPNGCSVCFGDVVAPKVMEALGINSTVLPRHNQALTSWIEVSPESVRAMLLNCA